MVSLTFILHVVAIKEGSVAFAYLPSQFLMLKHCFPYFSFTFEVFYSRVSRDCYHFSFGSIADLKPRHCRIKGFLRVISPGLELGDRRGS